jgi:hypothetical protein
MNERILELAKLAGIKSTAELSVSAAEQRFAELIIQECCLVIDKHYEPVYDGQLIKRYFGIE